MLKDILSQDVVLTQIADSQVGLGQDFEASAQIEGTRRTGQWCEGKAVDDKYSNTYSPFHFVSHSLTCCHPPLATIILNL
jgi:hypothetical protein